MCPSIVAYQSFETFWKPIVRVFQVFSVSHYAIYYKNAEIGRIIYFMLFAIVHVLLNIYTLKTVHYLGSDKENGIPLMTYVSFMGILGEVIQSAVIHLEPLFSRKCEEEMYKRLEKINKTFATKLNHQIDFEAIRKKQKYTMGFFLLSGLFTFGLSFFDLPNGTLNTYAFLITRAVTMTILRVRRCQASFVINLLSNILMDLQELLRQSQENYRTKSNDRHSDKSENMRYLRNIYSDVWLIKNLISCCFGWSFIAFIMDFCFDSINSSYWAYVSIKSYKSKIKTISELTH